jgi:hypothetical protein
VVARTEATSDPSETLAVGALIERVPEVRVKDAGVAAAAGSAVPAASAAKAAKAAKAPKTTMGLPDLRPSVNVAKRSIAVCLL